MSAKPVMGEPCTCGCGSHLVTSEFGSVCTCQCEAELKPQSLAQEIHELRIEQEAIDRRLHELIEARLRQLVA